MASVEYLRALKLVLTWISGLGGSLLDTDICCNLLFLERYSSQKYSSKKCLYVLAFFAWFYAAMKILEAKTYIQWTRRAHGGPWGLRGPLSPTEVDLRQLEAGKYTRIWTWSSWTIFSNTTAMSTLARAAILRQASTRQMPMNTLVQKRGAHFENTVYNVRCSTLVPSAFWRWKLTISTIIIEFSI